MEGSSEREKEEVRNIEYSIQNKDYLGCFCISVSCFFWVFSYIYPNEKNFSCAENNLIRGISVFLFNALVCSYQKKPLLIQKKDESLTYRRAIVLAVDGFILAIVQFYLPLPIVHTLGCTGIAFVFILDFYINGTTINKKQFIGLVFCIFGIILTTNGKWMVNLISQSYQSASQFENYRSSNPFVLVLAGLGAILNMLLWGYGCLLTKQIKSQNSFQLSFHTGVAFVFISSISYLYVEEKQPLWNMAIGFITIGVPSNLNFLLTNMGFKISKKTGLLSMMFFSSIIYGYFLSIFRYNESQNPICTIGIVLTVFGIGKTILNSSD